MNSININKATKTAVKRPSVSIIYQYAENEILPDSKYLRVLDFGCGKNCNWRDNMQKAYPLNAFFNCDMGNNLTPDHDFNSLDLPSELGGFFDIVLAANVVNVQQNKKMLHETLAIISYLTKESGSFFFNYPDKPRYMDLNTGEMISEVSKFFRLVQKQKRKGIFSAQNQF